MTDNDLVSLVAIAVVGGVDIERAWRIVDALPDHLSVRDASIEVHRVAVAEAWGATPL